jgi:hypothetical protein
LLDDRILTEPPDATDTSSGGSVARILVVEDQFVGAFLRSLLKSRKYDVVLATAAGARVILQADPACVDLLMTNTPLEFTFFPELPLLYLAANPVPEAIEGFTRALALSKPFHPRDLFDCIRRLLA